METLKLQQYSVEQYFEIDETAELRCEYLNGAIVFMAGSTVRHNEISGNIFADLFAKIRAKGKPCKTFMSDVRLQIAALNCYYYPDVMVVCGAENLTNNKSMSNPILLVEVLSESTQNADLTTKLSAYFQIDSLSYYLIVSQTDMLILCYEKVQNKWLLTIYDEASQVIALPLLELNLSVAEIYAGL